MRKKLTIKQKAANKAKYNAIRKAYEKTKGITTEGNKISYIQFKHRVEARAKADSLSIKDAAKKELNTRSFTTASELSRTNLLNAIKSKDPDKYKEIRYKSRNEKGKLTNIKGSLKWDKDRNGYVLNDKYFIDVSNSPEGIDIYDI